MKISNKCIELIKKFEGCKLTAYKDAVGVWTIGYGTTNAVSKITGLTVKSGVKITQAQADKFLTDTLNAKYIPLVEKYNAKYRFNTNQIDALVSFAYNIGSIDGLTKNGTRSIAEISSKITSYNKAGGKVLAGLTKRRKAEKELFDTPVEATSFGKVGQKFLYMGIDYSPVFDPTYYAEHHADVKAVYGNNAVQLFNHFTIYGMKEGRQAHENFNVLAYKNRYKDLVSAYGTNLKLYYQHYITHGRQEGRKATW